jgi:hypothetical protein
MAIREEPVRSFSSRIDFLTIARVAMVDDVLIFFSISVFYARCCAIEIETVSFSRIIKCENLAPEIFWVWKGFPASKSKTASLRLVVSIRGKRGENRARFALVES